MHLHVYLPFYMYRLRSFFALDIALQKRSLRHLRKMQLKQLLVVALVPLAVNAAGIKFAKKGKLDINQKVYIENQPVLGDGAGEGALNKCTEFAEQHVSNPDAPAVKVCGTGIKMTAYLRGRCEGYYEHHKEIGTCDTGAPPTTCQHYSPSDDPAFGHYQSYLIEQC